MSEARSGLLKRLVSSPWPVTVGLLVPLVLCYGAVQWKGLRIGALSHSVNEQGEGGGLMELWVHGEQPWFSWVPFIHPPGYSVFMNLTAFSSERLGIEPSEQVLLQGVVTKVMVVLLLAWAVNRWAGALWGVFAATLFTVSPNAVRPFEHYPVATLLSTLAIIAIVDWSLRGDVRARAGAIAAVFVAVGLHLSIWFVVGGTIATLFVLLPDRRREIVRASCWMIGLFLLTCWGLPDVLVGGPGHGPEKTLGGSPSSGPIPSCSGPASWPSSPGPFGDAPLRPWLGARSSSLQSPVPSRNSSWPTEIPILQASTTSS